jgi:NAD(P)-dependent dehydrogenase (short-subunit alcohol dehydrogenase family)
MREKTPVSKVLLITGAGRGIGAATAKLAAQQGYDVAINYLGNEKAANEVVAAVTAAGRKGIAIKGDMAREDDITRMFETVDRELGKLTHLCYNAGITGGYGRVESADAAMMRNVFELNAVGALLSVKAAVPRMSTKHGGPGGSIVLVSSMAASLGGPGEYVWYAATKGAVDSMTIGLSRELAADGIRVNAISPGLIATDIHPPGRLDRLSPTTPLGRAGTSEEVAAGIMFLLSDASSYTTGSNLRVAGGR